MKRIILLLAVAVCFFTACEKEGIIENPAQDSTNKFSTMKSISEVNYCGPEKIVDFLAGQHHLAGNIIVGNDAENLYVTFTTIDGWMLKATHLYAGACESIPVNNAKNPVIGKFPYKADHSPYVTSFTYSIPLENLPECMCIAAHAEVVKLDENNNIIQKETAWGEGNGIGGKSWAMKFDYCKYVCDSEEDPVIYQSETAWVSGVNYTPRGNWATYYVYEGEANEVSIFAGQNIYVGHASFSDVVDGYITITIVFVDDWQLQCSSETVKIQGYDIAPSGNPAPGQFTTYKGTDLIIRVPAYNYYGVHLDVRRFIGQ